MVEPDASSEAPRNQKRKEFLERLKKILRENRDLRNYIWGRVFFTLAFASYNFFAVFLVVKYDLPSSAVGTFTIITAGTYLIANPLLGILSDRHGHLFNHFLGSAALILATLNIVFAHSYGISLISIALGSFVLCVQSVSCFTLPMEFGEDHEIPIYVGLVGFFVGAASLLIIGFAWVAESFGYPGVFLICFVSAVISLFFFARTTEPRGRKVWAIRDVR
jgi:MFS family permease